MRWNNPNRPQAFVGLLGSSDKNGGEVSNVSFSEWALTALFFLPMVVSAWYLGVYSTQLLLRLGNRRSRASFKKWGVEDELFRTQNLIAFLLLGVLLTTFSVFAYFAALFSTTLVTGNSPFDATQIMFTLYLAALIFAFGYQREMARTGDILTTVKRLDELRAEFHDHFSPSELISVRECLRHSPSLFWEEYSNLPVESINATTNEKYRELAEPFRHRQALKHNRSTVVLAIVGLAIAAISAVVALKDASS